MSADLEIPSYYTGFAPRDGPPVYPSLWQGLVGAWASFLGNTGGTLYDRSGQNNNGILTGGPTWGVDPIGGTIDVADNSGAFIAVNPFPKYTTFSIALDFAIIAKSGAGNRSFLEYGDADGDGAPYLLIDTDAPVAANDFRFLSNNTAFHTWVTPPAIGVRSLVVITVDGTNWSGWHNGEQIGPFADGTGEGANRLNIGTGFFGEQANKYHWCGIWNRVITQAEIGICYVDPHALFRMRRRAPVKAPVAPVVTGTDRPFHREIFASPFEQTA